MRRRRRRAPGPTSAARPPTAWQATQTGRSRSGHAGASRSPATTGRRPPGAGPVRAGIRWCRSADPLEERDDVLRSALREVVLDHAPLAGEHRLGVLQEHGDPLLAAAVDHLGQLRRVVGAFAEDRVAAHAVLRRPRSSLPRTTCRRQQIGVLACRDLAERVHGEAQEDHREERRFLPRRTNGPEDFESMLADLLAPLALQARGQCKATAPTGHGHAAHASATEPPGARRRSRASCPTPDRLRESAPQCARCLAAHARS